MLHGITTIFVFDNNDPSTEYVGDCIDKEIRSKVIIIPVNYFQQFQKQAYIDLYKTVGYKYDWCGFIDIDEYIWCTPGHTIPGVLNKIDQSIEAVRLNWQIYGDDGILDGDVNIPVYKRIKVKLNHKYNTHAKCIVRGGLHNVDFQSVHYPLVNGRMPKQALPSGKLLSDDAKIDVNDIEYTTLYINHYMTKTWEEFKRQKLNRTDAALTRILGEEYFFRINPNTKHLVKDPHISHTM